MTRTRPRRAASKKEAGKNDGRATTDVRAMAREIPIDSIDWSATVRGIDSEHAERLEGAVALPPVAVWEFEKGKFRGIDGFHRWQVARSRGRRKIEALVHDYSSSSEGQRQFEFDSVRMNIEHGLPLTREQRDRAIIRLWTRWGRNGTRQSGVTLDELAKIFNLTKQRIHQVVASTPPSESGSVAADAGGVGAPHDRASAVEGGASGGVEEDRVRAAGFSPLGRFTAATRRLSSVLSDVQFVRQLLQYHHLEVREQLAQLRGLLDALLTSAGEQPVEAAPIDRKKPKAAV